jgi:hypothetical protein
MSILLERFLVLAVCLVSPHVAAASSPSKLETLTLFVKGATENMEVVREEVARLMEPAGFAVDWKKMSERKAGEDFAHLATVDFQGSCTVNAASPPAGSRSNVRSLASTAVVDGQVLPFSTVQCDALRQLLGPVLSQIRREDRPGVFGRAAARVLAHELFHMIAQTTTHGSRGVSKSCFGVSELTADRFEFDSVTVARMRPPVEAQTLELELEEFGGR